MIAQGMKYPRSLVQTGREVVDEDLRSEQQLAEIIADAREVGGDALRANPGVTVNIEVSYPSDREEGKTWDEYGDAVAVNFSTEPPTITTLPPYEAA